MPTENPRCTIAVPPDLYKEIENYWFENRYINRTQAILDLIRIGLDAVKNKKQGKQ